MAEGQAAQGCVRNPFFPARPSRRGAGWGGESGCPSMRYTPFLRTLDFWKVLLAQHQWKTASDFSMLDSPRSQTTRPAPTERLPPKTIHRREDDG